MVAYSKTIKIRKKLKSVWSLSGFFLLIMLVAKPCPAQEDYPKVLPKVIMLEVYGLTPYDTVLYQAIRAQLSASPLILDRVGLDYKNDFVVNPIENASRLAKENDAAMVFWIEDKESCRLFFYISDRNGGSLNNRTLELKLDSSWSRYQVIALAAGGMIEELLVKYNVKPVTPVDETKTEEKSIDVTPLIKEKKEYAETKRFEIVAAYGGVLFVADRIINGGCLGMGVRPIKNLVIAAAFTMNVPLSFKTEEYRLIIESRNVEVSTAAVINTKSFDIRFGAAWTIDLRSFSTTFSAETIEKKPDGFKGVNSLLPFVSAELKFNERVGIFGRVGASFALNDTVYKIERPETVTEELVPFTAKFTYNLGFIFKI